MLDLLEELWYPPDELLPYEVRESLLDSRECVECVVCIIGFREWYFREDSEYEDIILIMMNLNGGRVELVCFFRGGCEVWYRA